MLPLTSLIPPPSVMHKRERREIAEQRPQRPMFGGNGGASTTRRVWWHHPCGRYRYQRIIVFEGFDTRGGRGQAARRHLAVIIETTNSTSWVRTAWRLRGPGGRGRRQPSRSRSGGAPRWPPPRAE